MTELILIHRPRNGNPLQEILSHNPETDLGALWSTCLREIAFLSQAEFLKVQYQIFGSDEIYRGAQAFTFLVEVVCGLKSSLVGETEVQGQFKQFVANLTETSPAFGGFYSNFFQSVLSESKRVRTAYLKNLGSQSYGSLVRRRLEACDSVAVLGAGQLTQQILPWMKNIQQIHVHTRSSQKAQALKQGFTSLQIKPWTESLQGSVVIVAAPVSNENLLEILARTTGLKKLIDLRGEQSLSTVELAQLGWCADQYESLSQFMSEINQDSSRIRMRVQEAQIAIRKCGESYENKAWSRPGGWEDLCG